MVKLLYTLLCFLSLSAFAANDKIHIVAEHLPPYQSIEDGRIAGLAIDIANELVERVGVEASADIYPWVRAYRLAQTQPNVLILSISRSAERELQFHWLGEYVSASIYFWRLKAHSHITPKTLEEAGKYTIGVQRGDHQHEFLANNLSNRGANLTVTTNKAQAIKMFYLNRVDLILGSPHTLPFRISDMGLDSDLIEPVLPVNEISAPLSMALSKQTSSELVERFKTAFTQLKRSGQLASIQAKWLGDVVAKTKDKR